MRLFSLLEGAAFPAAYWSGTELTFVWMNRAFSALLEDARPQYDLLGMPVRGFLSDSQSAARFIDVAYTGEPLTEPEHEFRSSAGDVTYWQLTYLPVPGHVGHPFDVLLLAVDVTQAVVERLGRQAEVEDLRRAARLIDVTVLSSLDAEDILQRVLVEATEALGADWGWIAERDGGAWVFRNVHGWPGEMEGLRFSEDELSLPGLCARAGRPLAVTASATSSREQLELLHRHSIGAFAVVPIRARGDISAAMGFCWDQDTTFGQARMELLSQLELSLSLALENARQFDAERRASRALRGAFFTAPRAVPGFEIGHLYHSAAGSGVIGGDFYDVVPLEAGRLGLVIGDVSGHGLENAALTALVKSAIRAETLRLPVPDSVMDHANRIVLHDASSHQFVSAFVGVVDAGAGRIRYSLAGHPSPVLVRGGREPMLLEADGGVLGAAQGMRYAVHETAFQPGDLLVMYTDGLTEARCPSGESFGTERLLEAIAASAEEPAEALPESLFLSAFSFCEGRLTDDVAIVALRRSAEGAAHALSSRVELEAVPS